MPILNYTTQISVDKTSGEIQRLLVENKAKRMLQDFDDRGALTSISFQLETPHGTMTFMLEGRIERVLEIMKKQPKIPVKYRTWDQAARIAWRIQKDWLAAQLAIVQTGMVELAQLFLPYAQCNDGRVLYEKLSEEKFPNLALPSSAR